MSKVARRRTYTKAEKAAFAKKMARARASRGRAVSFRGNGDYSLYKAPRAIRASKSTTKSLGGTVGAHIGNGIHNLVKALTGFGDYNIAENSLMSGTIGGDPPVMRNTANNSFIVHHREYIGDVYATNSFTAISYSLNPGLLSTFPWLHQVADSFEQYRFRGLVFEYKTMSADSVLSTPASTALGTVIMSTQYNALDQPFTDKRTMENYEYANSSKPSCSFFHPIECKLSQTSVAEMYVRTGPVTTGDLRLYDLGTFTIATQGMQNAAAGSVIGELWLTTEVEFYKPKLLIGGGDLLTDHFQGISPVGFTTAAPFATAGILAPKSGNNLGCTLQIPSVAPYGANTILFPQFVVDGTYQITYSYIGSGATANMPAYSATGTTINIDVVSTSVKVLGSVASPNSYIQAPQAAVTGSNQFIVIQIVKIIQTAPGLQAGISFAFTGGTYPAGSGVVDLIITQVSPTFN
ncbi:capsid protein [Crucivirus-241]|nr:capsid protein [Crucivirus-241]